MKRLVFCFDGSWNRLDTPYPTNVLLTAESVLPMADGVVQVTFYDEGVGSEQGEELAGGMFGAGLVKNLSDGYRFLIFNYAPGDEIYVFGFSRGAYTARSFVGLLATSSILDRQQAHRANEAVNLYKRRQSTDAFRLEAMAFRRDCAPHVCVSVAEDNWRADNVPGHRPGIKPLLKVNYLGVWDTVGSLGIPRYIVMANAVNRMHQFHDVSLSPMVEHARHAVAIDEHKIDFEPTLWENLDELNRRRGAQLHSPDAPYQQRWFPGGHGSVGGGGERRGLSDLALDWIWDGARHAGLALDGSEHSHLARLNLNHREHLANRAQSKGFSPIGFVLDHLPTAARSPGPQQLYEVSPSARRRWGEPPEHLPEAAPYRPSTLRQLTEMMDGNGLHPEAEDLPPEELGSIYIVRPGDTLARIARRTYGSVRKADIIFRANLNKLADPADIHPGQALRLPRIKPDR